MENASKALIIAGAILLAILIIGLGVFIYNQAANTVNDNGMDQLAIRQFNGQFEPYLGRQLSSTAAKSLIDTIELNNMTNGLDKQVTGYDRELSRSNIKLGHKYETLVSYDGGRISSIIIRDVNSGGLIAAGKEKELIEESKDEACEEALERSERVFEKEQRTEMCK